MKTSHFLIIATAFCTGLVVSVPAQTLRNWTGAGGNNRWSVAANWSPAGVPANGDYLALNSSGATSTTNDLIGLRLSEIHVSHGDIITGNSLVLSNGIDCTGGGGINIVALDLQLAGDQWFWIENVNDGDLLFTGSIDLGGHTLSALIAEEAGYTYNTITFGDSTGGNITGTGEITVEGGIPFFLPDVNFAGPQGNSFDGTITVGKYSDHAFLQLEKTGGYAFTGRLEIWPSSLVFLGGANQIGPQSTVVIEGGGELRSGNYTNWIANLEFLYGGEFYSYGLCVITNTLSAQLSSVWNNGDAYIYGNIKFENNPQVEVNGNAPYSLTMFDTISGDGFTKLGGGTLDLSGSNTFTGTLTITEGTVIAYNVNAFGSTSGGTVLNGGGIIFPSLAIGSEALTVNGPSTLDTYPHSTNSWAGPITLNAELSHNDFVSTNNSMLTLSGVISGSGDLSLYRGIVRLSGASANTGTGTTRVNDGTLELRKSSVIAIAGPLTIGDTFDAPSSAVVRSFAFSGIGSVPVTIYQDGLLDLNDFSDTIGSLELSGGAVTTGTGALTLGGDVLAKSSSLAASISDKLNLGGVTRTFTVANGTADPDLAVSAVISNGSINKAGGGTLLLNGANTYAGTLTVNDGRVTLANSTAAGATGGGVAVNNDGVLAIDGSFTFNNEPLTLNSTSAIPFTVESGASVWTSTVALNQNTTVNVNSGASLQVSNAITGTGTLTKTGGGTLTFSGSAANTYTNATTVNEGTLILDDATVNLSILGPLVIGDGIGGANVDVVQLNRSRQIANTVPVTINSSGWLNLNNHGEAFGSLAGSGAVFIGTTSDLEVGLDNTSTTYSGVISGAGGNFWKHGLGTLTLNGSNTYTGFTLVEGGGKLLVNGSQPQSQVIVSNSATLGGSGTVGNITVAATSTVAPGNSAGILTCSNVTFSAGSVFKVELNGTTAGAGYDQLNVRGTVNLNNATLDATLGFAPTAGSQIVIVKNDASDAIIGTFNGLPEGSFVTIGGLSFQIRYAGSTGNDVTLTHTNPVSVLSAAVSSGNGNAAFEPNECSLLNLVLTNKALTTASNITATLVSETPGVTVTQPFSAYANLPNGVGGTNTTPFQITVASSFACGAPIALRLQVQTTNQGSFAVPVLITNIPPAAVTPMRFDNNVATVIPNPGMIHQLISVSNFNTAIARVEVSFFIDHRVDSDLDISLISPNGTRVELTSDNGGMNDNYGTNCADASRTRFSDLAAQVINGGGPAAPYVGTFRPEGSLADFIGKVGADVNGDWKFEVVDDSSASAGGGIQSTGLLSCVSLFIYPADCTPGSGICELCPDGTVTSALGTGSLQHSNRLVLGGIASTCAVPKTCPGITNDPAGLRSYEAHVYRNGPANACITASLTGTGQGLSLAVYTNSFDPLNLCANYLADSGAITSPSVTTQTCSFNIAANQVFVVVADAYSSADEGDYLLTVTGGDCRPQLRISPSINNSVVLDWTTATTGFKVETKLFSLGGNWLQTIFEPVVVNSRYQVTNTVAIPGNQFYRLRKPLP